MGLRRSQALWPLDWRTSAGGIAARAVRDPVLGAHAPVWAVCPHAAVPIEVVELLANCLASAEGPGVPSQWGCF